MSVRSETESPTADPSVITELATAYWGSMTLFTANRLGVFEVVAQRPSTADHVAAACDTHPRTTAMLLNACVGLGLLERSGKRYSPSATARTFLVPGGPADLRNALKYAEDLYEVWGKLPRAVRENAPAMPAGTILGDDPGRTRNFVYGMHDRAIGIARSLTTCIDLSDRRRLLDVGGGPGTYSLLLAQRFAELHADVLDLPEVVAISREIIAEHGLEERVRVIPGSYIETDFESGYDVVLMSGMLHRETPETCRTLLAKAYEALVEGGQVVAADVFFDTDAKDTPPFAALFALNMMLTSENGSAHAKTELAAWMANAGFVDVETRPLPPPMPHSIVSAVKS